MTFTQDAWEAIYRIKDESFPEERIVGGTLPPGVGNFSPNTICLSIAISFIC